MPRNAADTLTEFLRETTGTYLRGVVHYSPDDYDVLYLRDDVAELYPDTKMDGLMEYYRRRKQEENSEKPFDLGNNHCTVHFYDRAILFHFTQGESRGTVFTLAPEAGDDIVQFIVQCLERLYHTRYFTSESRQWCLNAAK